MLSLGYWIIDLPFWLLIGLIAGFLNVIPFIGPFAGALVDRWNRRLVMMIADGAIAVATAILALLQSGYPAEFVFRIGVQTINGVDNHFGGQLMQRQADPEFYELLRAINTIQKSDGLGMRVESEDDTSAVVLFFKTDADVDLSRELALIEKILRVSLIDGELDVGFGSVPENDRELAIQTRSMLQIGIWTGCGGCWPVWGTLRKNSLRY